MQLPQLLQAAVPRAAEHEHCAQAEAGEILRLDAAATAAASCCSKSCRVWKLCMNEAAVMAASCKLLPKFRNSCCKLLSSSRQLSLSLFTCCYWAWSLYIFYCYFFHTWLWCPLAVFSQRNKKDKKPNIRLYVLTYCINVYVCCFFVNSNNRIPRLSVARCRRWIGRLKGQYHETMEIFNMGLL